MKKPIAIMFMVVLLAGACGGGDKDDKADDTKSTTTVAGPKESAALKAKLITLDDLPEGFAVSEPNEDDDATCDALNDIDQDLPPQFREKAAFEGSLETDFAFVNEELNEYENAEDAAEAMGRAKTAFDGECKTFGDTDDDGTVTQATLSSLDFAKLGDESFAHKLTITIVGDLDGDETTANQTVTLEGALMVVRDGATIAQVMLSGSGQLTPIPSDFTSVANAAAAKL